MRQSLFYGDIHIINPVSINGFNHGLSLNHPHAMVS